MPAFCLNWETPRRSAPPRSPSLPAPKKMRKITRMMIHSHTPNVGIVPSRDVEEGYCHDEICRQTRHGAMAGLDDAPWNSTTATVAFGKVTGLRGSGLCP